MALPVMAAPRERSRVIYHTIGAVAESFEQATARLVRLADLAYGQRDYTALGELSAALSAIPYRPAQDAGRYFAALCFRCAGQYDHAAALLADLHQPRALQTLATIREAQGDYSQAARLHTEAMRQASGVDGFAFAGALIQLSAIKSIAGDHQAALNDLHDAWPLVRTVARLHPHLFYQYHNEIAVELAAVGQVEAARQAIAVAVASPIADRYPEWQATAAELREPERIAVVVVEPQEQGSEPEPQATTRAPRRATSIIRRKRIAIINARIFNPRAGPRAPPSVS